LLRNLAILIALAPLLARAAAPTTAPAAGRLDQSSPIALLKSFYQSGGEVDETTIRALLHASNPIEQQILDSVVAIELANVRLRAAERQKFGQATTRASITPPAIDRPEKLESLSEKIDGDSATIIVGADQKASLPFVRVAGQWKMPIGALVARIDPAMAETLATTTRAQIRIIDALTAEVLAGKLTSEAQVRGELSRRFLERLATATRSSTQPASPASTPGT
jgi:hypothetical protein